MTSSHLHEVSGSVIPDFSTLLANQTVQTLWLGHSDAEKLDKQVNAALTAMRAVKPKDELEGMLGGQLVAAHNAAMECYRRAMIPEQSFEGRRESLNQANKLSRTYTALLDGLTRYRNSGRTEQKMTVEHVHVHQGGQAIVGNVKTEKN